MDYEKKYKEALEKIRSLHRDYNQISTLIDVKEELENIFPELAECEDERIRKALMQNLKERFGTKGNMGKGLDMPDVLAWLEKQGEHKPANKIEPKFKVGDWVVYECGGETETLQITRIVGETYVFSDDSNLNVVDEDTLRLWDITKDAKAGDVLTDGNLPFIFKKIDANNYSYAYCGISVDDGFKIESEGKSGEWTWMQDIKPATKEQRDILFQKMHKAGYEWDADKKELKKVGCEADCTTTKEWSEEDESHIRYLIECLEHCKKGVALTMTTSTAQEYINWLKSLRLQSHWKPTDEQIKVLNEVINFAADHGTMRWNDYIYNVLKSLREQLKNL